jgi:hypothetical protein
VIVVAVRAVDHSPLVHPVVLVVVLVGVERLRPARGDLHLANPGDVAVAVERQDPAVVEVVLHLVEAVRAVEVPVEVLRVVVLDLGDVPTLVVPELRRHRVLGETGTVPEVLGLPGPRQLVVVDPALRHERVVALVGLQVGDAAPLVVGPRAVVPQRVLELRAAVEVVVGRVPLVPAAVLEDRPVPVAVVGEVARRRVGALVALRLGVEEPALVPHPLDLVALGLRDHA